MQRLLCLIFCSMCLSSVYAMERNKLNDEEKKMIEAQQLRLQRLKFIKENIQNQQALHPTLLKNLNQLKKLQNPTLLN